MMRPKHLFLAMCVFTIVTRTTTAQSLVIDTTFLLRDYFGNAMNSHALQTDGKIVFSGAFNKNAGHAGTYIARVLSNGVTDTAFGNDTIKMPINVCAVQSNSKILAGGFFNNSWGLGPRDFICRLNADGTLDSA